MLSRRFTFSERRWPQTEEFTAVARRWNSNAIDILFGMVWRGYDLLYAEVLDGADWTDVADDLERDLSEQLEPRIRRHMTGFEPFEVQHGRHEREQRQPAPAQPPQYDIAFYLRQQPRVMLPLEAKVLHSDKSTASYVQDVKQEFLTCRYAPFSSEAGMLAYLVKGVPATLFAKISEVIPCSLHQYEGSKGRLHKFSDHQRIVELGKNYPVAFRCHHLIFQLTK